MEKHTGQVDKQGHPYFLHVARVGAALYQFGDDFVSAGFLHDVVEDTDVTLDDLRDLGLPEWVVRAVDSVTKNTSEASLGAYEASIRRAMGDPIGRFVKASDVSDNASRVYGIPYGPVQARLRAKYEMAERVIAEFIPGYRVGVALTPLTGHLTGV
jgi:hypothetical protein